VSCLTMFHIACSDGEMLFVACLLSHNIHSINTDLYVPLINSDIDKPASILGKDTYTISFMELLVRFQVLL
jgi:hypothetical protein